QAEDGIRDFHVTGVQTCALPISPVTNAHSLPDRSPACRQRKRASASALALPVLDVLRRRKAAGPAAPREPCRVPPPPRPSLVLGVLRRLVQLVVPLDHGQGQIDGVPVIVGLAGVDDDVQAALL